MKIFRSFLALGLAAALSACYAAQKQNMLKEEFRDEDVTLPMRLVSSSVRDARTGVEARPLNLFSSSQQRSDRLQPAMTSAHQAMLQRELARYLSNTAEKAVNVTIEVTTGVQAFEANATKAKESSETEIKLTFADPDGRTLFTGWGRAKPDVESASPSQEFSDALFARALEMSLYAAVRRIKHDFFDKTPAP